MKKLLLVCALTGGIVGIGATTASADTTINGHNCAGAVVSSAAGPGFGATVSAAAHAQLVDNFGLRDCGAAQGQNP